MAKGGAEQVDPANAAEETWCAERRDQARGYLRSQDLDHGEIGEVPAWFVVPHLSIWAIESLQTPDSVGWWVICGDLPTDYCSADGCRHPRQAAKRIARSWLEAIASTKPGDKHIGTSGLDASLILLLQVRAKLLLDFSADDSNWAE